VSDTEPWRLGLGEGGQGKEKQKENCGVGHHD
jgi:hypothetical protein